MKYLYMLIAAIIGTLVLALKVQGGKLHRAQVRLLFLTIAQSETEDENTIVSAKKAFKQAYDAYIKANGEIK